MMTVDCVQKRLTELCDERRITYHALATSAGVHPSTMKSIMNGKSRNPGIVTIKKLCDGLDMTLGEFFGAPLFDELEQEIR